MPSHSMLFGNRSHTVNPYWLRWLALSAVIIVIDQVTKLMILRAFVPASG